MDERRRVSKSALAVSVSLVIVLLIVVAVFIFGNPGSDRIEIALPDPQSDTPETDSAGIPQDDALLQITPDNAIAALKSLNKPTHYHQTYSVSVGKNTSVSECTVELWVSDTLVHAEITDSRLSKTVLSDGNSAWIWYSSNETPRKLSLSADISMEDLLGLPTFRYIHTLESAEITDTEYLVLDDGQAQVPCIFISAQERSGALSRYWIDLETGLLRSSDCMENNTQVYLVQQLEFDRLVSGDESFTGRFMLPDGTSLSTEEANMQQPQ